MSIARAWNFADAWESVAARLLDAPAQQHQDQIFSCTPNEIRDLANKYLDPLKLTEVVVGGN